MDGTVEIMMEGATEIIVVIIMVVTEMTVGAREVTVVVQHIIMRVHYHGEDT